MGEIRRVDPVMLILAGFALDAEALRWARERAESAWGAVALESDWFAFDQTDYYEREMGKPLQKVFWAFERLIDPALLPDFKLQTNAWEAEYPRADAAEPARPLNLDPGYLTPAKLVLATTKDRDHRIYLRDGIFAEITLFFRAGQWQSREWTYPDFRQPEYHEFLWRCRERLKQQPRDDTRTTS